MARLSQNAPLLVIALLAVDGLHFVFARALRAYMHPVTSVVWVLGVGAALVAAVAGSQGQLRFETVRKNAIFFFVIGGLVAASTTINYTAVGFIDPGTASLLAEMSIVFGVGLGVIWLRERLTRWQIAGAVVAIAGVIVITFHPGDYLRAGALMVLASSALYALHAGIVKRYGDGIDFLEFFVWRLVVTTAILMVSAGAQRRLELPPSAAAWALVLAVGTVDVVISRSLYYLALRRLPVTILSLILTLSPVVAILWSLALFGTQPGPRDLVGGLAVLAGVGIVTYRKR
jgi:drug/metabolite transporter (DMT)-like permease